MTQEHTCFDVIKHSLSLARMLAETLPCMNRFAGKTFVIKCGGCAMGNPVLSQSIAKDVVLLKQLGIHPVVVHGGASQITRMLDRLDIRTEFRDGLRVTDEATLQIVEMVLSGKINKDIAAAVSAAGGMAVGLSGKDGRLIQARKLNRLCDGPDETVPQMADLGFVGEPTVVNVAMLRLLEQGGIIPVIAPLAADLDGQTYNINADTVAGAIAAALHATRLLFLSDVAGVIDQDRNVIPTLTLSRARALVAGGTISGGMIPKLETCIAAVEAGVEAAAILDVGVPHALLLEIFTNPSLGTTICPD